MKNIDKFKTALLGASIAAYAMLFAGSYYFAGRGMSMSAVVVVLAVGWIFGAPAGGLAGLFSVPLNYVSYALCGLDLGEKSFVQGAGLPETAALVISGMVVGRLSSLSRRLKFHQNYLSRLVEEKTAEQTRANEQLKAQSQELLALNQQLAAGQLELSESKKFLENVFQTSGDGIFVTDDQGYIISANKAFLRMSGYTLEELLGRHVVELSPRNLTTEKMHPVIEQLYDTGFIENYETVNQKKDGTVYYVEQNLTALKNEQGEVVGAVCSSRDITGRKEADEELKKTKEQLENVIESSLDSVVVSDSHGYIIKMNRTFLDLLGCDEAELLGKTPAAFSFYDEGTYEITTGEKVTITEDYFEAGRKVMEKFFEEGRITNWEYLFLRQDGKLVPIEGNIVFIKSDQGDITGSIAVIRDITDRRRAENDRRRFEAQLKRAEKMEAIGTLAGGVAHDLNNILSGIINYPELLLLRLPEASPLRKPIETVKKSGERAAAIVNDLLTLARRGVETSEIVSLNEVVSTYLESPEYRKFIGFHPGIDVVASLDKDLLNLEGSQVQLMKVVMNLVHNAAEAMPGGGIINVSTRNQHIEKQNTGFEMPGGGDYVVLSVADTGIGIPKKDREKIFEPFYTKKKMGRSGTGLGMSVVWGTVKDHRGFIDIKGREGEGTTFVLHFPATGKAPAVAEAAPAFKAYSGSGEKILVVDDVDVQREIATNILAELGYRADSVPSGEAAIEYLKTHSAELIVLDMIMDPGMDGCETYQRILEEHPGQKAIIASGYSETERVRQAQQLGARQYVKKPYTAEKIGRAVKAELAK